MTEELRTLVSVASPLLLSIVAWFVRVMMADIRDMAKAVQAATVKLELHDARIVQLERETMHLRIVVDDLRGFLARMGFRERVQGEREET